MASSAIRARKGKKSLFQRAKDGVKSFGSKVASKIRSGVGAVRGLFGRRTA